LVGWQAGTTSGVCAATQDQQQRSCCDFEMAHQYRCLQLLLISVAEALLHRVVQRSVGCRQLSQSWVCLPANLHLVAEKIVYSIQRDLLTHPRECACSKRKGAVAD
jgi:hypothetical protein